MALLAGLLLLAVLAGPALARTPVYRDPPTYKGVKRAPATQPPPLPPHYTLSGTGVFPDALVDDAGTAHIVWNEGRGDLDDAAMYCRLKRGGTGCDATATLTWPKTYGSGDGPQYNIDNDGPKIVRVGDQLVVLSKRYPTVADKPDGASSETVIAWTSSDGGTTWTGPAIVGKDNLGQLIVIGPPDDPTIVNFGVDPLCDAPGPSAACIEAYKSGQYTAAEGNLSTGSNQNYYPGLAMDRDQPVEVINDLDPSVHVRRFTGAGDIIDPNTWIGDTVFSGSEPSLAGGPAGAFVLYRADGFFGPQTVRSVSAGPDGRPAAGPPNQLSDQGTFGKLFEDPSGRLVAAWSQRSAPDLGVVQRVGTGGNGFAPAQKLIDGDNNGQISLGATNDGGGFAVFNHTGGVNSMGEITAVPFGTQSATGRPGLGNLAGGAGANTSCQMVKFGSFTVDAVAGCFLHGTGSNAGVVVTGGEVNIDGLRIVPDPGAKLVIDPKKLRIDTTGGSAQVIVSNGATSVVLWHGQIHRDLSRVAPGGMLFEFPSGDFKANVLGFDVSADIPVRLENDGVHIPIDLALPPAFGGFAGHAELIADKAAGLHLNSLHIHIGPVPLGVLVINTIDIDYMGQGEIWRGSGSVTVPAGGKLDASVEFDMGDFKQATISFTPATPIPIGPFVYLLRIGGGFGVNPIDISAQATIGAGAAIQGTAPVDVVGTFEMKFPKSGPATFRMDGRVDVLLFSIGTGFLQFQTDGYASFGGHTGLDFGPLSVDANMDGFVDGTTGNFGSSLNGTVSVCFDLGPIEPCGSVGADAAVSNIGFAACGRVNPPDPFGGFTGGIEFPWSDFTAAELVNPVALGVQLVTHVRIPCSTSGFRIPPPRPKARAAQAGGAAVAVPGGHPSETILVEGDGGAPDITVTGPGGATFKTGQPSAAGFVASPRGVPASYVVLNKPAAGDWSVVPNPGSPAVKQVMVSDGFKPATVTAKLGGKGRKRTIAYKVANAGNGQSVQFAERGAFGTRLIGKPVTNSRGTVRFAPAPGRAGRRTVLAFVQHDGMRGASKRIGTYTAPAPPGPGRPGKVKAKRGEHSLALSWGGARGAKTYVVRLKGAKGTRLAKYVKGRSVRFTAIRRDEKIVVEVRGVGANMRTGPASNLTSKGARR